MRTSVFLLRYEISRLVAAIVLATIVALLVSPHRASAATLSNTSDLVPQTNGRVWAIVVSGDTVYIGGSFTEVITQEGVAVPRSRLAAINATDGRLLPWNPGANRVVLALAADGNRIYAGGNFTRVGGRPHSRLAAIDATTGAVDHSWNPSADLPVRALLAASGGRLYLGGDFRAVNGQGRSRLALVHGIMGELDPNWAPAADGPVRTLALSPDGGRLYAGGDFATISGKTRRNLAALDASTGALDTTWPRDTPYSVHDLEASGTRVYVAGGGAGGNAAAFDASTGAQLWRLQGDGDFQAVAYLDGQVYFGGHFKLLDDGTRRVRLLAVDATTGALSTQWKAKANRGVWAVEADAQYTRIYAGGGFYEISGLPQQGFAQFSAR